MGEAREKACQHCGKLFRFYTPKRKFCDRACAAMGQKRYYGHEHPRANPLSRARGAQSNSRLQAAWSMLVIARDGATCQNCGVNGVRLHAHHILSWKDHPADRFNTENGITLCSKCHHRLHAQQRRKTP